ncbi:hypothetical protein LJC68_06070 [Bacteroidales bacterium OttesenSCG-928-B11]|nr:hypothetical protein [Bacteroidales bacterium OttesenSCG-928-B11]
MKNYFNLSKEAIQVLKRINLRWEISAITGINDPRTIMKHLKQNFPDGPLMNRNIGELIKEYEPSLSDRTIYHKLNPLEIEDIKARKGQLQEQNAKYNNAKHG